MAIESTDRDRAKANRRTSLLTEAARLFASHGYSGVSLEDLGTAVGISGPAVYRHFSGKQALLGSLLTGVSERLHAGGIDVVAQHDNASDQLRALIYFHVQFALSESDVIRVQDRDLSNLSTADHHDVRRLQRAYIDEWIGVLGALKPAASDDEKRLRVQACFGLLNSTPHSVGASANRSMMSTTLAAMAEAALLTD